MRRIPQKKFFSIFKRQARPKRNAQLIARLRLGAVRPPKAGRSTAKLVFSQIAVRPDFLSHLPYLQKRSLISARLFLLPLLDGRKTPLYQSVSIIRPQVDLEISAFLYSLRADLSLHMPTNQSSGD